MSCKFSNYSNRTDWSRIQFEILPVVTKLDDCPAYHNRGYWLIFMINLKTYLQFQIKPAVHTRLILKYGI